MELGLSFPSYGIGLVTWLDLAIANYLFHKSNPIRASLASPVMILGQSSKWHILGLTPRWPVYTHSQIDEDAAHKPGLSCDG